MIGSMRPWRASSVRSWVYCSSNDASAPPARDDAFPGRAGRPVSQECSVKAMNWVRNGSRAIPSNDGMLPCNRARYSSRSSSASNSSPERTPVAPNTLAWTTASSISASSCLDSVGVRVLPVLNSSRARLISLARRSRSNPSAGNRQARSPPSISSNSSIRCSISTKCWLRCQLRWAARSMASRHWWFKREISTAISISGTSLFVQTQVDPEISRARDTVQPGPLTQGGRLLAANRQDCAAGDVHGQRTAQLRAKIEGHQRRQLLVSLPARHKALGHLGRLRAEADMNTGMLIPDPCPAQGVATQGQVTALAAQHALVAGSNPLPGALVAVQLHGQIEVVLEQVLKPGQGSPPVGQQSGAGDQGSFRQHSQQLHGAGRQPAQGAQLLVHRAERRLAVRQGHSLALLYPIHQAQQAVLEQIEKRHRAVIAVARPLLQPFLIGIGQRTVRAAEAEHLGVQGQPGPGHFRIGDLAQAADLTRRELRQQRPAQAHHFSLGITAGTQ